MGAGRGGIVGRYYNIMRLLSFLYIAASHMAHAHYFVCVYMLLVVIYVLLSYTCYFRAVFFSPNIENVRECCKLSE